MASARVDQTFAKWRGSLGLKFCVCTYGPSCDWDQPNVAKHTGAKLSCEPHNNTAYRQKIAKRNAVQIGESILFQISNS